MQQRGIFHIPLACILLIVCLPPLKMSSQVPDTVSRRTVIAGKQYAHSGFHNWLWGKHYRKDWSTPVSVQVMYLDTVNGGLTAYEKGGGRQSRNLHLQNPSGKQYVLRSIDKSFGRALPEKYRGTFIESIANDQVSIAEPYAALTIAPLAKAAGIYHTEPVIVYIPSQPALGEFNGDYGNDLYLFEQRPDENWEEAGNFGNAKNIIGTERLLEHLFEDNKHKVDQQAYIKARLFDMLIGDWGRHEDQWRWAAFEENGGTVYKPIPRDRDQVYTKFDGLLLSLAMSVADLGDLEGFSDDIKNVSTYNYPARNLDRKMTNEATRSDWLRHAHDLKMAITDEIIDNAIKKLPPEVYAISGANIAQTLKARRDRLEKIAGDYYDFLSENVTIPGTRNPELYNIRFLDHDKLQVSVYGMDKNGTSLDRPFYTRTFEATETDEIRIYGLAGKDQYTISGQPGKQGRIRLIGGPDNDRYLDSSGYKKLFIYDNRDNTFITAKGSRKKLSENPFVHLYVYDAYRFDKKGLGPVLFYSTEDRIHVGLKYTLEKQAWRKYPFGQQHEIFARYSINEQAPSFAYLGWFPQLAGNWDLRVQAEYDFIRWNNFFGVGNERLELTQERDYHRVRSREMMISAGFERWFTGKQFVSATVFYQGIKILNDPGRFLTEKTPKYNDFGNSKFAGARLNYEFQLVDDPAVPSRGVLAEASASYTMQAQNTDSSVAHFSGSFNFFVPLSRSFIFSFKAGGATLSGKPEFYQLNKLSGSRTLRGYRKFRFYGESMAYTQTEVQFIRNVRSKLFNGKAGLIWFFDMGRVWQPEENSERWHKGYGAGVLLSPFGRISAAVFFARSADGNDISVRFRKGL